MYVIKKKIDKSYQTYINTTKSTIEFSLFFYD